MNKENSHDTLREMFYDLYFIEKQAKDLYSNYLLTLKDPQKREVVEKIRDEEIEHMKICEEILRIINLDKR